MVSKGQAEARWDPEELQPRFQNDIVGGEEQRPLFYDLRTICELLTPAGSAHSLANSPRPRVEASVRVFQSIDRFSTHLIVPHFTYFIYPCEMSH